MRFNRLTAWATCSKYAEIEFRDFEKTARGRDLTPRDLCAKGVLVFGDNANATRRFRLEKFSFSCCAANVFANYV